MIKPFFHGLFDVVWELGNILKNQIRVFSGKFSMTEEP